MEEPPALSEERPPYPTEQVPRLAQLDFGFSMTPAPTTDTCEATAENAPKLFVEEMGVEPSVVEYISRMAVRAALASLHREALTNERETHGLLQHCYWEYGTEGCFHLCGILEASQFDEPGDGWEILNHTRPLDEWKPFMAVVEKWLAERTDEQKARVGFRWSIQKEQAERNQRARSEEAR